MPEEPEGLEAAARTLSRLLLAEESLEATLARVASLACRALDGCDVASVTMIRDRGPVTAAQTDPDVRGLDDAQYSAGAGPCLEAHRTGRVISLDVPGAGDRWPEFVATARAAGIQAVLSVPLVVGESSVGALNLYSRSRHGFSEADQETARLFSEQVSVACANAEVFWRTQRLTENLREALETRDVIGQAKGILMARRGLTADAAFDALRRVSMQRNVKLRNIAEDVVYTGDLEDRVET